MMSTTHSLWFLNHTSYIDFTRHPQLSTTNSKYLDSYSKSESPYWKMNCISWANYYFTRPFSSCISSRERNPGYATVVDGVHGLQFEPSIEAHNCSTNFLWWLSQWKAWKLIECYGSSYWACWFSTVNYGHQIMLSYLKEQTELQPYLLERLMEVSPDSDCIYECHSAKNFARSKCLESSSFGTCH